MLMKSWKLVVVVLAAWLANWSSPPASQRAQADGRSIRIEFNETLHRKLKSPHPVYLPTRNRKTSPTSMATMATTNAIEALKM